MIKFHIGTLVSPVQSKKKLLMVLTSRRKKQNKKKQIQIFHSKKGKFLVKDLTPRGMGGCPQIII